MSAELLRTIEIVFQFALLFGLLNKYYNYELSSTKLEIFVPFKKFVMKMIFIAKLAEVRLKMRCHIATILY